MFKATRECPVGSLSLRERGFVPRCWVNQASHFPRSTNFMTKRGKLLTLIV
jgi:hypothetical protein